MDARAKTVPSLKSGPLDGSRGFLRAASTRMRLRAIWLGAIFTDTVLLQTESSRGFGSVRSGFSPTTLQVRCACRTPRIW